MFDQLLNELIAYKNTDNIISKLKNNDDFDFIPSSTLRTIGGILIIEFKKDPEEYGYNMYYHVNTDFFNFFDANKIYWKQNYECFIDRISRLYIKNIFIIESGYGNNLKNSKVLKIPYYPNLSFTSKFHDIIVYMDSYTQEMLGYFENCEITFTSNHIWSVEDGFDELCINNDVGFKDEIDLYAMTLNLNSNHFTNSELASAHAFVENEVDKYLFLCEYFRLDMPLRIQFTGLCTANVNKSIQFLNMLYSDLLHEIDFEISIRSPYDYQKVLDNSKLLFFDSSKIKRDNIYYQTEKWEYNKF